MTYEPITELDLDKAADLLELDGWCQGTSYSEAGEYCLISAVAEVRKHRLGSRCNFSSSLLAEALDLVGNPEAVEPPNDRSYFPHLWNDRPGRTKEEVVARLRQGAQKLRGEVTFVGTEAAQARIEELKKRQ